MNEFLFIGFLFCCSLVFALVWCGVSELFKRWLNNDWCRHDWDMWTGVDGLYQYRFCKKCNKAERRAP